MIVNKQGLSDILGRSIPSITALVGDGMPGTKTEKNSWEFDTVLCVKWLIDREVSKAHGVDRDMKLAELRERSAKAGLAEIQLAEKEKAVVRIEDVAVEVGAQFAIVKSRFQAIPGRMAQRLAALSDPKVVQQLLKDEVADALEAISDPENDVTEKL